MGRGSNSQALDAKELLYGPRRRRELSEVKIKAIKQEKRDQARKQKIDAFASTYNELRDKLASGNGRDFLKLEAAGHGMKGQEKKELRKIIDAADTILDQAIDRHDPSADMIVGLDDLAGLISLYDRAVEAKLPQSYIDQARFIVLRYNHALANEIILDELEQDSEKIGAIPETYYGRDYSNHILIGGRAACNNEIERYQTGHPTAISILDTPASCSDCSRLYQKDSKCRERCQRIEPERWTKLLLDQDSDHFGIYSQRDFVEEGSEMERAEAMLHLVSKRTRQHLNSNLAPFSDYRISETI